MSVRYYLRVYCCIISSNCFVVGYGNIAPRTFWGRVVCMTYAMLGIPLMLICLSNIGNLLGHIFKRVYSAVCLCHVGTNHCCGSSPSSSSSHGSNERRPQRHTISLLPGGANYDVIDQTDENIVTMTSLTDTVDQEPMLRSSGISRKMSIYENVEYSETERLAILQFNDGGEGNQNNKELTVEVSRLGPPDYIIVW